MKKILKRKKRRGKKTWKISRLNMSLFIIRPLVCNACDDTSYEEYEYVYCLSQTCEEGIAIFPENVAMETIMETIRVWTK